MRVIIPTWVWLVIAAVLVFLGLVAMLPLIIGALLAGNGSSAGNADTSTLMYGISAAIVLSIIAIVLPWKILKGIFFGVAALALVISIMLSGFWTGVERQIVQMERCVESGDCSTTNRRAEVVLPSTITIPRCDGPNDFLTIDVPRGNTVSWTWSVVAYALTDGVWVLIPTNSDGGDTVEAFAYCADKAQHVGQEMPLYWH